MTNLRVQTHKIYCVKCKRDKRISEKNGTEENGWKKNVTNDTMLRESRASV